MDYDFITTCNWKSTGTYTLRAYRGSDTNVVTSYTLYYRKKGTPTWNSTSNGQINITSTGEWEVANDWNRDTFGNLLNHSYYGITAIDECTDIYMDSSKFVSGEWAGNNFLAYLFYGCSNLTSMPDGFNIPSNITAVGYGFLYNAWYDCSKLESMPNGFNIPNGITIIGNNFLYNAWYGCSKLESMPNGFNLPQGVTSVGIQFLRNTWGWCTSLTSMPEGFNIPEEITSIDSSFCYRSWYFCTSLTSMPEGFNIPQGITNAENSFFAQCWSGCTNLQSMPRGFNIPNGLTSVGTNFLSYCWKDCKNLNQDGYTEDLVFKFDSEETFGDTCPIVPDSITGASPANPVRVAVNRFHVPIHNILNVSDSIVVREEFSSRRTFRMGEVRLIGTYGGWHVGSNYWGGSFGKVLVGYFVEGLKIRDKKILHTIKTYIESLKLTDFFTKSFNKVVQFWDSIVAKSGAIRSYSLFRKWDEGVKVGDTFKRVANNVRGFVEALKINDVFKTVNIYLKTFIENVRASESYKRAVSKPFKEVLRVVDNFNKGLVYIRSYIENVVLSEVHKIAKVLVKKFQDSIEVIENFFYIRGKNFKETIKVVDNWFKQFILAISFTEVINVEDILSSMGRFYNRVLIEVMEVSDSIVKNVTIVVRSILKIREGKFIKRLNGQLIEWGKTIRKGLEWAKLIKKKDNYVSIEKKLNDWEVKEKDFGSYKSNTKPVKDWVKFKKKQ